MRISYLKAALPGVILLSLSACIDKDYDLSDVNTLSQVKVTDLVVPVNIDAITLDDVIDIKDDDQFNKVKDLNGNEFYAFTESGEFNSDPIFVDKVTAKAPTLEPTKTVIYSTQENPGVGSIDGVDLDPVSYEITKMERECNFSASNVDDAIVKLSSAKTNNVTFKITLEAKNISGFAESMTFSDLKFQLIKGMTTSGDNGSYNPETGIWTVNSLTTTALTTTFSLNVTGFDFEKCGAVLNTNTHTFSLPGEVSVLSGTLTINPKRHASVPSELDFEAKYSLSDLVIKSFCGRLHYALDGMDIDPIKLDNIPDFLSGDDTNLFLSNPQIYLTINNPVADENLKCRTGLTLTAQRPTRNNIPDFSYSPDSKINIGCDHGITGPYNYVLAPKPGAADINMLDSKYSDNLTSISFPGLKNIVGVPTEYNVGSLPDFIAIELDSPEIIESNVTDFELGRNIEGVKGYYDFVAPLSLSTGSSVVYTKRDDGWNDETVDAVTISKLTITATATNKCPVAVTLKAYPVDINGNRISNVTISSNRVEAEAIDESITITMEGTISHLDGIDFVATLEASDNEETLTPQQSITLTNVHATISGELTKEL